MTRALSLCDCRQPDGVDEFVKTRPAGPGAFGYEATGLRWLAAAGRTGGAPSDEQSHGRGRVSSRIAAGRTGGDGAEATAPVVEVLAMTEHRLTLERLAGPDPDPAANRQGLVSAQNHT